MEDTLFKATQIDQAIERLALDIFEDSQNSQTGNQLALIGIATGGVPLAKRIGQALTKKLKIEPPLGILDITFYRDDIALREAHPVIKNTEILFSLDDKHVVLVDDVLFSGRTTRAAMDALVDFGRPALIRLAVLVDRGHRELPIRADFVGFEMKTGKSDLVQVNFKELGASEDSVTLIKGKKESR